MISEKIEAKLNAQVSREAASSQLYLAMASWAEVEGFEGVSTFLYRQSDEEREHMLKLVKFINERGGRAIVPELKQPPAEFESMRKVFEDLLNHEQEITNAINELVHITLEAKDYTTHRFLQWYVEEQLEEEALAQTILDKLKLIGDEKGGGLYMFDRDITEMSGHPASEEG